MRLVERYVFGVGSEIVAPDVKMDVDVDGVAAIGRAELTEEELADLRDFGPPPKGKRRGRRFQSEDASWINGAKFSEKIRRKTVAVA